MASPILVYGREGCAMCHHFMQACKKAGLAAQLISIDSDAGSEQMFSKARAAGILGPGGSIGLPVVEAYGSVMLRPSIEKIKKLRKVQGLPPPQRAAAGGGSSGPRQDAALLFKTIDRNDDGVLSHDEISNALSDLGYTDDEITSLVLALDTDSDGVVGREEFEKGWLHFKLYQKFGKGKGSQPTIVLQALDELNNARRNPQAYAASLKPMLTQFEGKRFHRAGRITLLTQEGKAAVQEAIVFLEKQKSLPPLTLSPGLSYAALDLLQDHGPQGKTGHTGSDGSDPFQRMSRYGQWGGTAGENCAYGGQSGKEHVDQLIVDDGVASRGHRTNIFNPKFLVVGIAVGGHTAYGTACIQDFAHTYREADSDAPVPPDMPVETDAPSREQAAAAAAIQRKHRSNAAKEVAEGMRQDKQILSNGQGAVVEAEGAITPELEAAMGELPDDYKKSIKQGLADGLTCRITTVTKGSVMTIKVKLWGARCTMNMEMRITRG